MRNNLFESIVKDLMGVKVISEDQNPIIAADDDISRPQDGLEVYTGPGIIVAVVKYDEPDVTTEVNEQDGSEPSTCGFYQVPIGAVDNFRFYKVNEINSLNSMRDTTSDRFPEFQEIWKKYSIEKGHVIDSWKEQNPVTYENLQKEFGDALIGADIIPNDKKKIEPPKEDKKDKKEQQVGQDAQQGIEDVQSDGAQNEEEIEPPAILESFGANDANKKELTKEDNPEIQAENPVVTYSDALDGCVSEPSDELTEVLKVSKNCVQKVIKEVNRTKSCGIAEGEGDSQQLKMFHRDLESPICGGRIVSSNNGKRYLVLSFTNCDQIAEGTNTCTTLEDLRGCLTEAGVKRISKDISGIFASIYQKNVDMDKEGKPLLKIYPISNVHFNKDANSIVFETDSRKEVKEEQRMRAAQFS